MKNTALALISALFVLSACETGPADGSAAGGAGGAGNGTGNGILGTTADGTAVGDRVFYELDSSVLSSEAQAILGRQAEWLKQYSNVNVVIEGHCDERGTREYNLALGERRAAAVKSYLTSMGVDASRVSTISYGKERPAVVGNDESAWGQNRRGVTVIGN
jgi:peptidoglycan-associated lipoprotein